MEYDLNRGMWKLFNLCVLLILNLYADSSFEFELIKKGQENNNTLLVVGGIQGDEPGGFMAASILSTHYEIKKGSLWVVPNLNFYSIIQRGRGAYGDMNRKFKYLPQDDPEYTIVERIKHHINEPQVKIVVNLHDGSGYYRTKYIDALHSPDRWGQCSIIDQAYLENHQYGDLESISAQVVEHVNQNLIRVEDRYGMRNTQTRDGNAEMEKTLTYYAINQGKAAFGNEASKSLPTHERVYYHLLALEKYMQIAGIEFERKFSLTPRGVYGAINNDIYISLYDDRIRLPLSEVRDVLSFVPLKKDAELQFKGSNPLLTMYKDDNCYLIQYGNRRLARIKPEHMEYDDLSAKVLFEIDGKERFVEFGEIVDVKKSFIAKDEENFRINVIGYSTSAPKESGVEIQRQQILKRYSVDKEGKVYRVEYYNQNRFCGMVLVKFI